MRIKGQEHLTADCHTVPPWLQCLRMGNVHIWPFSSLAEGVGSVSLFLYSPLGLQPCGQLYTYIHTCTYVASFALVKLKLYLALCIIEVSFHSRIRTLYIHVPHIHFMEFYVYTSHKHKWHSRMTLMQYQVAKVNHMAYANCF